MMADAIKIIFSFAVEASPSDLKTNVRNVKTMQIAGEHTVYGFPAKMQNFISLHSELAQNSTIKSVLAQMDKRGKTRTIRVKISETLRAIYIDEDENVKFRDIFLDPISPSLPLPQPVPAPDPVQQQRSFSSLTKEMVVIKFDRKQNPITWMNRFEKEAARMLLPKSRFAEALRLFLDGSGVD